MKEKFKIGDTVKCINSTNLNANDELGTIIYIDNRDNAVPLLVEFYKHIDGHDGQMTDVKGKAGHCWWLCEDRVKKLINALLSIEKIMTQLRLTNQQERKQLHVVAKKIHLILQQVQN